MLCHSIVNCWLDSLCDFSLFSGELSFIIEVCIFWILKITVIGFQTFHNFLNMSSQESNMSRKRKLDIGDRPKYKDNEKIRPAAAVDSLGYTWGRLFQLLQMYLFSIFIFSVFSVIYSNQAVVLLFLFILLMLCEFSVDHYVKTLKISFMPLNIIFEF